MPQPSLLFPAPILPPEGSDLSLEDSPESVLESWLAVLPSGGPGYLLAPGSCDRKTDPHDEQAPGDLLALIPPDPSQEATLGLDFRFLDRAMRRAWDSVPHSDDASPADQAATLFNTLSSELGNIQDWSTVWSWDSRGPGEIEICLRALCRNGSAPVLYHEALPDVSGNSAKDILAAGLLSLFAVASGGAETITATSPMADEPVIESEGEFTGLLREISKPPNAKQAPVRVNDALLKNMEGAEVEIIVDRGAQRAYLVVDGAIAIDTPVSTGAKGHTTPLGSYTILEKKRSGKISTIYHCPLPRWMRLTWRGIGMHVGDLPGYPASHGCIRLPEEGATALFDHTPGGTTVSIVASWDGAAPQAPLLADN